MTSYVDDNLFPKLILVEGAAPASPASGDQSLYIDSGNHHLHRVDHSGATTDIEAGGSGLNLGWTAPPALVGWTWFNQGGAVGADGTNPSSILLQGVADSGYNLRGLVRAVPATPYTVVAAIIPTAYGASSPRMSVGWRQSSGDKWFGGWLGLVSSTLNYLIAGWSSLTSGPTNYSNAAITPGSPIWFKLVDNGTNMVISVSCDGKQWLQLDSRGDTSLLTATHIGIAVDATASSSTGQIELVSWTGA